MYMVEMFKSFRITSGQFQNLRKHVNYFTLNLLLNLKQITIVISRKSQNEQLNGNTTLRDASTDYNINRQNFLLFFLM